MRTKEEEEKKPAKYKKNNFFKDSEFVQSTGGLYLESEDDYHSSVESYDFSKHLPIEVDKKEIEAKPEVSFIDKNKINHPYIRGIFHCVDIAACERVNFSYIKLPNTFSYGKASGREKCEIAAKELNDKYVGIAQYVKPSTDGLTDNESKNALLRSEDQLYLTDQNLFQAKMSLKFLMQLKEAENEKRKEIVSKKFRKHAGEIDNFFKECDLDKELDEAAIRLKIIIQERKKRKNAEVDLHVQRHVKLFAKSLDQKLYNMILEDRSNYGRDIINLFSMCRQLEYEVILSKKGTEKYEEQARKFMRDIKFIWLQRKNEAVHEQKIPSEEKLWPIITLNFSNMRVLEATFMFCFESIEKHCVGPQRDKVHTILQYTLAKIFKVPAENFIIYKNTKFEFERNKAIASFKYLEKHVGDFKTAMKNFEFKEENLPDVEPENLPPFDISNSLIKLLLESKPCNFFLNFQDEEKLEFGDSHCEEGLFCLNRITRLVILFSNLYQRINMFWELFNECARESINFDLLKVFDNFKITVISPIHTIEGSYQAIDPEVTFERIFGRLGPIASNISNLVTKLTKHFVFASYDEPAFEFISLQHDRNFKTRDIIDWLVKNYGVESRMCFQLMSYSRLNRKLIIHNIPLQSDEEIPLQPEVINLEDSQQTEIKNNGVCVEEEVGGGMEIEE